MKRLFHIITIIMAVAAVTTAIAKEKPHVYINPGHGGHSSDDRNVVVYPFAAGDTAGFWESNASLKKGFALNNCLKAKGYTTSMSRVTNDEGSDLNLSTIVALCNSSGADIFYAIHSNATGVATRRNHILGLYRGPTGSPVVANSDVLTKCLMERLSVNEAAVWTSGYQIAGDFTFYPDWNNQGLGVLRGNTAVSMLSEGSFHDYVPETYRLLNDNYCWLEGWNFSLGADDYFGYNDYDKGAIGGNLRDNRMPRVRNDFIMFGDDNREPVSNATVILRDAAGNAVDTCYTDDLFNGIYAFKMVAPGTYSITASQPDYYSMTKTVTVEANKTVYCNMDMARVRSTPPEIINYSPVWHEGDAPLLANTPIVLEFNWDMNTEATEAAFKIEPAVEGTFRWEDSNYRMIFEPKDAYDVNTLYTVTLGTGAEHGGGMKLEKEFKLQFLTTYRKHLEVLDVFPHAGDPVHYKSANIELRTDSLLNTGYYYNNIIVTDAEGNVVAYNRRSVKSAKSGDRFGYIRIPIASALTVGNEYTLSISQEVADTAGIHLPAPISYKFTAVDAGAEKPDATVIEDFEDATAFKMVTAAANGSESTSLTASTDRLFGSKSLQIKYDDVPTGVNYVFRNPAWDNVAIEGGKALAMHIFGDMSYTNVSINLSATGYSDHVRVDFGDIDYHGWRYVTGKGTLKPGKTYKIDNVVISSAVTSLIKSGTIKLDNLLTVSAPTLTGDVNCDGSVNAADVTALYNYILNGDETFLATSDVNGDGAINAGDVTAVYNIILGL